MNDIVGVLLCLYQQFFSSPRRKTMIDAKRGRNLIITPTEGCEEQMMFRLMDDWKQNMPSRLCEYTVFDVWYLVQIDAKLLFHHGVDGWDLAGAADDGGPGLCVVLEQGQVLLGHSHDVVDRHLGEELHEPLRVERVSRVSQVWRDRVVEHVLEGLLAVDVLVNQGANLKVSDEMVYDGFLKFFKYGIGMGWY